MSTYLTLATSLNKESRVSPFGDTQLIRKLVERKVGEDSTWEESKSLAPRAMGAAGVIAGFKGNTPHWAILKDKGGSYEVWARQGGKWVNRDYTPGPDYSRINTFKMALDMLKSLLGADPKTFTIKTPAKITMKRPPSRRREKGPGAVGSLPLAKFSQMFSKQLANKSKEIQTDIVARIDSILSFVAKEIQSSNWKEEVFRGARDQIGDISNKLNRLGDVFDKLGRITWGSSWSGELPAEITHDQAKIMIQNLNEALKGSRF